MIEPFWNAREKNTYSHKCCHSSKQHKKETGHLWNWSQNTKQIKDSTNKKNRMMQWRYVVYLKSSFYFWKEGVFFFAFFHHIDVYLIFIFRRILHCVDAVDGVHAWSAVFNAFWKVAFDTISAIQCVIKHFRCVYSVVQSGKANQMHRFIEVSVHLSTKSFLPPYQTNHHQ